MSFSKFLQNVRDSLHLNDRYKYFFTRYGKSVATLKQIKTFDRILILTRHPTFKGVTSTDFLSNISSNSKFSKKLTKEFKLNPALKSHRSKKFIGLINKLENRMNTEEDSEFSAYERHIFGQNMTKKEDKANFLKV